MNGYMIDTHFFDYIFDKNENIEIFKLIDNIFITNIQNSEINNIGNSSFSKEVNSKKKERGEKLNKLRKELNFKKIPITFDTWRDDLLWDDDSIFIDEPSQCVEKYKGKSKNEYKDAKIACTALEKKLIIVTNDKKMITKAKEMGLNRLSIEDFIKNIKLSLSFNE